MHPAGYGLQNFDPSIRQGYRRQRQPRSERHRELDDSCGAGQFPDKRSSDRADHYRRQWQYQRSIHSVSSGPVPGRRSNPYISQHHFREHCERRVGHFLSDPGAGHTTMSATRMLRSLYPVLYLTPGGSPTVPYLHQPGRHADRTRPEVHPAFNSRFRSMCRAMVPPVPNVSLRLIPNQSSPTVSCATGAGADPGSVLTNANGTATCTVIFGPTKASAPSTFLVGGVTRYPRLYLPSRDGPCGFFQTGNLQSQSSLPA